ncbi:hypothetical protein GTV15_18360, partial [Streptomyces sp. SID7803]|nr:hypothetical protein [Streptomyces sp. SID7803]
QGTTRSAAARRRRPPRTAQRRRPPARISAADGLLQRPVRRGPLQPRAARQ